MKTRFIKRGFKIPYKIATSVDAIVFIYEKRGDQIFAGMVWAKSSVSILRCGSFYLR